MSRPFMGRAVVRVLALSHAVIVPALAEDSPPLRIDEIVVTATPFSSDPNKLATLVGQVDREQILRSGGANLADALEGVPGVTGTGFAAGASRPIIRGFDATRVKVLENGVGSFDVADVGPDHGVPIDPLSTQEIEVVRGAATLRFGSQAIGGVVNAINNRVPLDTREGWNGEASATYGTGANTVQGAALIEGRSGGLALHADGFARDTDDYRIPGGTQSNSFFEGNGVSFGAAALGDSLKAGAAVVRYASKYGIPAEDNFIDMTQTKGMWRSVTTFDAATLNFDAGYADYAHSEKDPAGIPQATFKDKEWDARAEAVFDAGDVFSAAALGVQLQDRDFSALGEGADYLLPTHTGTAAAFAFAEAPLSAGLKAQFGARAERVRLRGTPLSNLETRRKYTPLSGSIGLVAAPSDAVTLGLTVSTAARAPAQTELFARGPHEGSSTFELGNDTLRTERSNSVEATARLTSGGISAEGAVWAADFDRYIYGRLTGRSCDDEGACIAGDAEELRELIYEQRGATFRGLEFKAVAPLGHGFTLDVMADYVRATLAGGDNVPRIPPYHLGAGLTWTERDFSAGVSWSYAGAQRKVGVGDTPTDGYHTLNARLGWRPLVRNPDIELSIVGRNLTDSEQRNAVSLNKDEVVLPGRDVRFVVRSVF